MCLTACLPAGLPVCVYACVCATRVCDILLPKGRTLRIRNVPAFTVKGVRVYVAHTQRARVFRLIAGSNGISQHVKWSVYVSVSLTYVYASVCLCVCVYLRASVRVAF